MRLRHIRHIVLMAAVGFSWGFVAKTFANTYLYTGYDDPQVVEALDAYEIKKLFRDDATGESSSQAESEDGEVSSPDNTELPKSTTPGTVSI